MSLLRRSLSLLVSVGVLGAALVTILNAQNIIDWWRLKDYDPPARIAELADHTAMTDLGQKLFFVHKPELSDRTNFGSNCPGTEYTIVLGCYITHSAIYIFDVEDKRLDGIEEVTAAHEMLHAAYDRLDGTERERINKLLLDFYDHLDNPRIISTVKSYEKRDPAVVPNELHSIIGTEVRDLPSALEDYYQQYFSDRDRVVGYSEQYEEVFEAQRTKLAALATQIETIESAITAQKSRIEQQESSLAAEADHLSSLRNSNQIEEYNAAVPGYNAQVNAYRNDVDSYNARIRELNELVNQYNDLAVEQRHLYEAIDSRPQTL